MSEKGSIPAYAYLRVSGVSQTDGTGFSRQEEAIRSYATKHGYKVIEVFREEGVSGTTDETNRPAFQAMMVEILRNGAKTVIVEGLDRLAREYRIQETLLVYLASKGVDLISASTGENVTEAIQTDPMRKALVQIQAVFSELEKNLLVRKLRNARDKIKRETGKCGGSRRYGEDSKGNPIPEEQAIIRRVKLMRRRRRGGFQGMTLREIAAKLNEEGIPTVRGGKWGTSQVRQCLVK